MPDSHEQEDGKNVGIRIKEERKKLNLSQYELETRAGLCRNYLSMIETGKRAPALSTITKIAKVLGVPMNYLIERRRSGFCPVTQDANCAISSSEIKIGSPAYEAARLINGLPKEKQSMAVTILKAISLEDKEKHTPDMEDELG